MKNILEKKSGFQKDIVAEFLQNLAEFVDPSKNPSLDSEFYAEFDFDSHFRCIDFFKKSQQNDFFLGRFPSKMAKRKKNERFFEHCR